MWVGMSHGRFMGGRNIKAPPVLCYVTMIITLRYVFMLGTFFSQTSSFSRDLYFSLVLSFSSCDNFFSLLPQSQILFPTVIFIPFSSSDISVSLLPCSQFQSSPLINNYLSSSHSKILVPTVIFITFSSLDLSFSFPSFFLNFCLLL